MQEDNPCFGCVLMRRGLEVKAPCCHDVSLVVNKEEYLTYFLDLYLRGLVMVDELLDRETDEMFYAIQVIGACFYLSIKTGECLINSFKPKACDDAEPGHFSTCVR